MALKLINSLTRSLTSKLSRKISSPKPANAIRNTKRPSSQWPRVSDLILGMASARGKKVALCSADGGESITYEELPFRVFACARRMQDLGVQAGSATSVLIFARSCSIKIPIAFLALSCLNVPCAFINPDLDNLDQNMLEACDAAIVICDKVVAFRAAEVSGPCLYLEDVTASRHMPYPTEFDILALEALGKKNPAASNTAAIFFSSGSTGVPKPVRHSHRGLISQMLQMEDWIGESGDGVTLCNMPQAHVFGAIVCLYSLWRGEMVVVSSWQGPMVVLEELYRFGATTYYTVPSLLLPVVQVLRHGQAEIPVGLRKLIVGGGVLSADVARSCTRAFGSGARIGKVYGMTEAGGIAAGFIDEIPEDSAGTLLPEVEARVGGDTGSELLVQGPNVCSQGWLATGDMVRLDEDGNVYFEARIKDIIKVYSCQVSTLELEAALKKFPGVQDAAVVGIPDPKSGEKPVAFVVGNNLDGKEQEIKTFCDSISGNRFKRLDSVTVLKEFPRSIIGKVVKRTLVAMALRQGNGSA